MEEIIGNQVTDDQDTKIIRTPLSVPFNTTIISDKSFKDFLAFLDTLSMDEQEGYVNRALKQIKRHKKWLKKTKLSGNEQDIQSDKYDNMLSKLNKRLIQLLNKDPEPVKSWDILYNGLLNSYIKDVSLNDFNEVMNYKRLPNGKSKITWTTKKAEAVYFQKYIGFTMKQFNECFIHKDGTQFKESNRLNTNPEQSFIDIINK
jgi:hypothetical protein